MKMKHLIPVFLFLPLLPSCDDQAGSRAESFDNATSEAEPEELLLLSTIFGDVVISEDIKFPDDSLAEPALRNCELHQAPIYKKRGYDNGILLNFTEEYITYLGLADVSGYCPNMSPYGTASIDTTPRWSGAEPYSIEYCCACNHVFQVGRDRFMQLPEKEQIRWRGIVRESFFKSGK